jgi:hypothetical protein
VIRPGHVVFGLMRVLLLRHSKTPLLSSFPVRRVFGCGKGVACMTEPIVNCTLAENSNATECIQQVPS